MRPQAYVGFILALALLPIVHAIPPVTFLICAFEDSAAPVFTEVAVGLDIHNETTPTDCHLHCLEHGYIYAAMSEGVFCFCSADIVAVLAMAASAAPCDAICDDGFECGSLLDLSAYSVYDTGGGSPNFTLAASTDDATIIDLVVTPDATGTTFLVDYGYGAPLSYFNATASMVGVDVYLVPGDYEVTVIGMIEGTKLMSVQTVNLTKTAGGVPSVDLVYCPIVVEPEVPYYCNITVTPQDDTTLFTATYSDTGEVLDVIPTTDFYRLGHPPPRSLTSEVLPPVSAAGVVLVVGQPITVAGEVIAYDLYAHEAGAFTVSMKRPGCASGLYCVHERGCMAVCPHELHTNQHTCPAPQMFCPGPRRCTDGSGTATCLPYEVLPTGWDDVAGSVIASTFAGPGFHREVLAAAVPVIPGDVLHVTGPVGRMVTANTEGDEVDGLITNDNYFVEAIVKENLPVQVEHMCTTVNTDVLVDVVDVGLLATLLTNHTSCERNITDIDMKVHQIETDTFDGTLNVEAPWYIRTVTPAVFTAIFSVAGPTYFVYYYFPEHGTNHTFNDTTDYPYTGVPYEVEHSVVIPLEGVYTVTITAQNQHNVVPGLVPGPVTNETLVFAQHEVVSTWTVVADSPTEAFLIPQDVATFRFIDTALANFPTNATARCNWGDGTPMEELPFANPGDHEPVLGHTYTDGNVYTMSCYIYNKVSGYNVTCEVLILEQIFDFAITNKYFPTDFSVDSREGFGNLRNMFAKDRNLTFYPEMSQGSVDVYEVHFTVNGSQIFTFTPADRFDPTADFFFYHFDVEEKINMTVYAKNILETVSVDIFVEILQQTKIVLIDDFSLITEKDEEKTFEITLETIGGGTCLVIDWGDSNSLDLDSYGDEYNCMLNFSHAVYHPDSVVELTNTFTHVYKADGIYNISVLAYNPVSRTSDMLMFLVTSINCRPPTVQIMDGTLDYLAAPRLYKADDNGFSTIATVDCEVTSKTKKRWQIYDVDDMWGYIVKPILTMDIVPTWNMSEMVIPGNYLPYGRYALTYTLTMWDPLVLDPNMPFQQVVETYIEIIPTPLVPCMFEGGVFKIIRGLIQEILFDPGSCTKDPDSEYPDAKDQNYTIIWKCRQVGETWPPEGSAPLPVWPLGSSGTGCFGYGPGYLDYEGTNLTVLGSDFLTANQVYEMEVLISKDTRTATAVGQVEIVPWVPPILEIRCLHEDLCVPTGTHVRVNPSYKLALTADCIAYCNDPYSYLWTTTDVSDLEIPSSPYQVVGNQLSEFALSPPFFDVYEQDGYFKVSCTATDVDGVVGGATYNMQINRRPTSGTCSLTVPPTRLAMIDLYKISCSGWIDPDGIGIKSYSVTYVNAAGKKEPLTEMKHSSSQSNEADVIFPAGIFDVYVSITDDWDAYTDTEVILDTEVLMPTEEQLAAADIPGLLESLAGAGNLPLLTMLISAQNNLIAEAPWLSLDPDNLEGLTQEEIDARTVMIAEMNNNALDALGENAVFSSLGVTTAIASSMAGMCEGAALYPESFKTIDMEARDKVADISEDMLNGIKKLDVPSADHLIPLVEYMSSIAGGMALGQKEVGDDETCQNTIPSDVIKSDQLPFDTSIKHDTIIPEDPTDIRRCNTRDITRKRAERLVPQIESALDYVTESTMKNMVVGEEYSLSSGMDIHVKLGIVNELKYIPIGLKDCGFYFPDNFCPQGSCYDAVGYSAREWPFITHAYPGSAEYLAPGTKAMDLKLYSRGIEPLVVENLPPEREIKLKISRTPGKRGNTTIPDYTYVDAITESASQSLPIVYTTFNISKPDSSVDLDFVAEDESRRLFMIISKPRLPTLRKHELYYAVEDIRKVDGIHRLFIPHTDLSGMGKYYLGIGEYVDDLDAASRRDPVQNNVTMKSVQKFSTNYKMRIITSGCYFFDSSTGEWKSDGMSIEETTANTSLCRTNHLTSFGTGMFVMPNTIDFNYVFTHAGFTDNLTIYLTLIVSLSIFVILMIWARLKDRKDLEKLGATPLPDNKVEDKYFYEVLVFTGNKKGAQTESLVQFIVSGEYDETDVRTFADSKRKIFRKDGTDVFVMAVPRPLGHLQFLRIWHDNSGKGSNASWYLCYVVFRDVQSGDKYEFICNQWLGVEHDDGQIDRLIQAAGREQKTQFSHLYNTTKNKNIADGHLWFSVFLRPPRSRFTRCQRVGSCFALLFLSMLANAMWYDTVAEKPGAGGLNLGPFHLSPEQIGVGVMSNLIVFPPSILIVFLFRKSRPKELRKSRIEKAYKRTKREKERGENECEEDYQEEEEESEEEEGEQIIHKKVIQKKEKNKKFSLPWWVKYIAWVLVFVCIAVSCFFLLMYGIMFGNSKATKWVTSLVISFFSSILFVQPLKIFLTAMLMSAIFKSVDLDEDDADEDEEEPNLEQDEMWLHRGEKLHKNYKQKKIDEATLLALRKARKKEVEMWSIIKEIFSYGFFLWIFLILSYGNRDPYAFYMKKSLQEAFLHEGALDDTDYTLVNTADRFWKYLYSGFMTDLRADYFYNGKPPYGLRGFFNDWCNRVMGYAIIRQIRIKENTCRVPAAMYGLKLECRAFSSIVNEDDEDYCLGWKRPTSKTENTSDCNVPEFKYETAEELHSLPVWGQRDWYGGGGYVIHLKDSTLDIYEKFHELHSNGWIDARTRAILIEFSSYNSQVNLFGLSLIMAEFVPGGGINPSFRFEGIRLLQHHDNFGAFVIVCEIIFVLFVLYFTGKECSLFYKQRRRYFDSYWSYAEISIIITCYIAIILYALRYIETYKAVKTFADTMGNGYIRLQYAASLDEYYGYAVAFIVFVGTIKFAKLLRFNKRIGVLSATLHQCWDDLSGFLMAFFLCFCSFVMMFYFLLNMYLESFHNFIVAIETCFSMMLGKFQFEKMKQASMMVPIMFFVFVVFNSWVLINLLLTLIIKSFQQVKHDIMRQPNEYEMVAFIRERIKVFLGMQQGQPPSGPLETVVSANGEEVNKDNDVNQLPDKVDRFLDYLNQAYFAGSLDVQNRDALKSSFYRSQLSRKASGIMGKSAMGQRSAASNKDGLADLGKDSWRGSMQGNTKAKANPLSYEGPRISNKFQADLDDI